MSEDTIIGHCVCKQYTVTIPRAKDMNLCHCTDCRRWAGSMYSAHILAEKAKTKIDGPEPRTHTVKGVNGSNMTRAWCDTCGSGLWIQPEGMKEMLGIKAGLFNPGDIPDPTHETFTKDMEPWEKVASTAKQWEINLEGL